MVSSDFSTPIMIYPDPSHFKPEPITFLQVLKTMKAPSFQLFNSFNIRDRLTTHNIDGASSKIKLSTMYVVVRKTSDTGDVIGCSAAALA